MFVKKLEPIDFDPLKHDASNEFLLARGVGSPSRKVTHIRTPQRPQADMYEESGHYGVGPPTVMPPASACPPLGSGLA